MAKSTKPSAKNSKATKDKPTATQSKVTKSKSKDKQSKQLKSGTSGQAAIRVPGAAQLRYTSQTGWVRKFRDKLLAALENTGTLTMPYFINAMRQVGWNEYNLPLSMRKSLRDWETCNDNGKDQNMKTLKAWRNTAVMMGFIVMRSNPNDKDDKSLSWGRDQYISWDSVEMKLDLTKTALGSKSGIPSGLPPHHDPMIDFTPIPPTAEEKKWMKAIADFDALSEVGSDSEVYLHAWRQNRRSVFDANLCYRVTMNLPPSLTQSPTHPKMRTRKRILLFLSTRDSTITLPRHCRMYSRTT